MKNRFSLFSLFGIFFFAFSFLQKSHIFFLMTRHLFLHELLSQWRKGLLVCGGMVVAFSVALLFGWRVTDGRDGSLGAFFTILLSGLFFVYSISQTFSCLRTKQGRISFFMLPASLRAKFGVRILLHTLGVGFAILLSFVVAERLLVLLLTFIDFEVESPWGALVQVVESFFRLPHVEGHINALGVISQVGTVTNFLFVCSANLLGSVCFRKHSFVQTQCILFLLFTGFVFLMGVYVGLHPQTRLVTDDVVVAFSSFFIFLELLATVACLWGCWRWFGRLQVIPRSHLKIFSL